MNLTKLSDPDGRLNCDLPRRQRDRLYNNLYGHMDVSLDDLLYAHLRNHLDHRIYVRMESHMYYRVGGELFL